MPAVVLLTLSLRIPEISVFAAFFCFIHCKISLFKKLVCMCRIIRIYRETHTHGAYIIHAQQVPWRVKHCAYLLHNSRHFRKHLRFDNNDKFIPSHSVAAVANLWDGGDSVGNFLQKNIAILVSQAVIDLFEIIEIQIY